MRELSSLFHKTGGVLAWLRGFFGVELDPVSFKEKLVSLTGGVAAIFVVMLISQQALHQTGAAMVIASMGASAVLLFAVPHGQLSQPWPVIAGHGFSALIGVFCARHIPDTSLAGACAVGLSIGVMHQLKCIHPPGGATALTAVVGGSNVHALGYSFIWMPVLANALVIVAAAILFNGLFAWRRYPAFWNRPPRPEPGEQPISHEEVVEALKSFNSFVDITEADLIHLHHLLSRRKAAPPTEKATLTLEQALPPFHSVRDTSRAEAHRRPTQERETRKIS